MFALGAIAVYWIAGVLFEKTSVALGAALVYNAAELALGRHRRGRAGGGGVRCCRDRSLDLLLQEAIVGYGIFGATALAFASQFRPESGLVLAVAAIAMLLLAPGSRTNFAPTFSAAIKHKSSWKRVQDSTATCCTVCCREASRPRRPGPAT